MQSCQMFGIARQGFFQDINQSGFGAGVENRLGDGFQDAHAIVKLVFLEIEPRYIQHPRIARRFEPQQGFRDDFGLRRIFIGKIGLRQQRNQFDIVSL